MEKVIDLIKKKVDLKSWHTGFLKPQIGFFGNTGDYYGAVSPSGVLREKYHQIRRANLFFNTFESLIAASGQAKRSIYRPLSEGNTYAGKDLSVVVRDKRIGVGYRLLMFWSITLKKYRLPTQMSRFPFRKK